MKTHHKMTTSLGPKNLFSGELIKLPLGKKCLHSRDQASDGQKLKEELEVKLRNANLENQKIQNDTKKKKLKLKKLKMETLLTQNENIRLKREHIKELERLENGRMGRDNVMTKEMKLKLLGLEEGSMVEDSEVTKMMKLKLQEDPRNVDTLVDFIEDGTPKGVKTKLKKRKNRDQTVLNQIHLNSVGDIKEEMPKKNVIAEVHQNIFKILPTIEKDLKPLNEIQKPEATEETKDIEESMDNLTSTENEKEGTNINNTEIGQIVEANDVNAKEIAFLAKCVAEKEALINEQRRQTNHIVECKSVEMTKLLEIIQAAEDQKSTTDSVIGDLNAQILELQEKKASLAKKQDENQKSLTKVTNKKKRLDDFILSTLDESQVAITLIENEVLDLKVKLADVTSKFVSHPIVFTEAKTKPSRQLLDFISQKISAKEEELECPVCFHTASCPIYMCEEQHLVCWTCRPKLQRCPECRLAYSSKERRHRYAERAEQELRGLRQEKEILLVGHSPQSYPTMTRQPGS